MPNFLLTATQCSYLACSSHQTKGCNQDGICAQECKLNAVTDMVRCFADVVDAATGAPHGEGPDPVQVIAGLYQAKTAGAH